MDLLTEQDILSLIQIGEEMSDLDYKADIDLSADKKDKVEIAKDVIAMANSGGGMIVGGVRESLEGFVFEGMPEKSLKVFDSTPLNDFVKNYCDPPINTTTRKLTIDSKVFGVVIVPEFSDQPHIITKEYPQVFRLGDIFIRSASNNSTHATPNDLRHLINIAVQRRQGVLKNFFQAVFKNSRPVLVGGGTSSTESFEAPFDKAEYSHDYKGFRIVKLTPEISHFVPLTELKSAAEKAIITNLTPGTPIFPSLGVLNSIEKRLPTGLVLEKESEVWRDLSFTYLDIQGGVFYSESLMEDHQEPPQECGKIGMFATIRTIFRAVLFARKYYPSIGYEGNIEIQYSQESSVPRILYMESQTYRSFYGNFNNEMTTPVMVKRNFHSDSDLEQIEEIVIDMMTEFFWYFYYDLDHDRAADYLDYVKSKHIAIPQSLLPKSSETEG